MEFLLEGSPLLGTVEREQSSVRQLKQTAPFQNFPERKQRSVLLPKRHDPPRTLVKGPRMSPFYRWENRGFGSSNSSTGLRTYLHWLNFTDPGPGVLAENT